MPNIALIDGDVLVYRSACTVERNKYSMGELVCGQLLDEYIANIVDVTGVKDTKVYLTGVGNFREKLAKSRPYKGNRKKEARPALHEFARNYLVDKHDAVVVDGMEADDALAMAQYAEWSKGNVDETVICTVDKDLRTVPGWYYSWYHSDNLPEYLDELGDLTPVYKGITGELKAVKGHGLKLFYAQVLMGDSIDNIPGLKGVGATKAYNLLKDCNTHGEFFETVVNAYVEKMGLHPTTIGFLHEQARLLWIVRERNEDGELKIWEPLWRVPTI